MSILKICKTANNTRRLGSFCQYFKVTMKSTYESQRRKTYLQKCAPSEDSDQPAHSRSLIRIFTGRILDSQGCEVSSWRQRKLWCAGWFESSFSAHFRRDVLSYCGSYEGKGSITITGKFLIHYVFITSCIYITLFQTELIKWKNTPVNTIGINADRL